MRAPLAFRFRRFDDRGTYCCPSYFICNPWRDFWWRRARRASPRLRKFFEYFFGRQVPPEPRDELEERLNVNELDIRMSFGSRQHSLSLIRVMLDRINLLQKREGPIDPERAAKYKILQKELMRQKEHWIREIQSAVGHVSAMRAHCAIEEQSLPAAAADDIRTLTRFLSDVCRQLEADAPQDEAAALALASVRDALHRMENLCMAEAAKPLREVQDLLACCVEVISVNILGTSRIPLVAGLQESWTHPSDHIPVGARISLLSGKEVEMNVVTWNVLNTHYMKYIYADTQGLKNSLLATMGEEARTEELVRRVIELLENHACPKHVVCLQECWPEFLDLLEARLSRRGFAVLRSGAERDQKNQEAIVYDVKGLDLDKARDFRVYRGETGYARSDPRKGISEAIFSLKGKQGKLRVITTHVPGVPFGPAREEFCQCVARIEGLDAVPTIILGDFNFPEEAFRPLLRHIHQLRDVHFVPFHHPTNIMQGSLLPKRIDHIASLSPEDWIRMEALEPSELFEDLPSQVELLEKVAVTEPDIPTDLGYTVARV